MRCFAIRHAEATRREVRELHGGGFTQRYSRRYVPNGTRELEPMSGTRAHHDDVGHALPRIDDEVMVRGVGIQTDGGLTNPGLSAGKEPGDEILHDLGIRRVYRAIDSSCINGATLVMDSGLHAIPDVRHGIEDAPVIVFDQRNGELVRTDHAGIGRRREPVHRLPRDDKRQCDAECREQRRRPRTGANDDTACA